MLPWWARCIRFVLFPVEVFGWALTRQNHYDILTDTYLIHGMRFSGRCFELLAAEGECVYKFKREGDLVVAERISFPKLES